MIYSRPQKDNNILVAKIEREKKNRFALQPFLILSSKIRYPTIRLSLFTFFFFFFLVLCNHGSNSEVTLEGGLTLLLLLPSSIEPFNKK